MTIKSRRLRVRGLIFPFVLVVLGVVLLLNNMGILTGNIWRTIFGLWPALLIIIGLDNFIRWRGLTGPIFLIGLGVVFLLGNLGALTDNVWNTLLRLWPVLIISAGLDLLLRNRSIWFMVLGFLILLVLLGGAIWFAGDLEFFSATSFTS